MISEDSGLLCVQASTFVIPGEYFWRSLRQKAQSRNLFLPDAERDLK